jgi:hypothetical protein
MIVNRRTVPVPVPLRTLDEACAWAAEALVKPGFEITRVFLDGRDVEEQSVPWDTALGPVSQLEIMIDAPHELALQSAETVHHLCGLVVQGLEHLAVAAYTHQPGNAFPRVAGLQEDMELVSQLGDHLLGLVPGGLQEALTIASTLQYIQRESKRLGFPLPFPRDAKAFAKEIANDSLVPAFKALSQQAMLLRQRIESDRELSATAPGTVKRGA